MDLLWSRPDWIAAQRKKGLGEGEGPAYRPWLNVRNCSTHGMACRVYGHTAGRVHHLMSKLELGCFLLLDASDAVVDIQEQYPLHTLDETREIAAELGVRHPAGRRRRKGRWIREDCTMTADFRVKLSPDSRVAELWIAVKPSAKLNNPRTLQKLEIERRYAERRGAAWQIVTEKELPPALVANLSLISRYRSLHGFAVSPEDVEEVLATLHEEIARAAEAPLRATTARSDQRFRLAPGTSLALAWHAVATRRWHVDLTQKLDPALPLQLLGQPRQPLVILEAR